MQERQQSGRDDRSLGELFGDLARELGVLVRQELTLARTEMTDKATRIGKHIGALVLGGAVAYAGFLALVATAIIALGEAGLPWWLSALIVGLVVAVAGYLLVQRALSALRREELAPRQTMESLRDDARFVKEQTR